MGNTIDRKKLSSYSAILALLVILIHTDNTYIYASLSDGSLISRITSAIEWVISKDIASIAVPSFFMISGVLFYRDFTIDKYPQKLKSRIKSLIIPFLLWNLFRFLLFYVLGKLGIIERYLGAPRLVFSLENLIKGVFFYKYNLGFWFMYQLILLTLVSPVIRLLVKNKWAGLVVILSLVALFSTDALGSFLNVTLKKRFLLLDCTIFYIIGAYIGTHFFDFVNKKNKFTKMLAPVGIVAGQALYILFLRTGFLLFYILFLIISSIAFWYLYDCLGVKPMHKAISSITFFIYALHGTVLEFLQAAAGHIFADSAVAALITYITFPAITLAILVFISIALKKYTPKFWSIICGAR